MSIAIAGATGRLGRIVVDKLKGQIGSGDIIALARNPEKARSLGVAVRGADYTQSESLNLALAGVETLMMISASEIGQRVLQHANILAAAKAAGVKRIVYTSLLHADTSPLSLAAEHRATETAIKALGVRYTILRNGWYTENYLDSLAVSVEHGAIVGSVGEGRISSATRDDFAEAAVAVLTGSGDDGATYELAGDQAWTMSELAAEVSRQAGKSIVYKNLPEGEYAAMLSGFGLPSAIAAAIASWDIAASQGALYSQDRTLSKLIGRATTPLSTAVSHALKSA